MTTISALWFLLGVVAGSVHVWMLWQTSQSLRRSGAWYWIRLPLIGSVLVAAAVCGGILPTAAGWALAYFATVGVIAARRPA